VTILNLRQLAELMEECGDRDPAAQRKLDETIGDVPFEDLGFDSLSLFNTCVRIENDHPVTLSLDDVLTAATPNALLDLVNQYVRRSA
jgi:act minimal PKS acyl carrier protein